MNPQDEKQQDAIRNQIAESAQAIRDQGASDVVIIASWQLEDGRTTIGSCSLGNLYATHGMIEYLYTKHNAEVLRDVMDTEES